MEQRDGMMQDRERTATEKGEFLRLQRLEDERKVARAALRKQITNVNSLFEHHQETDVMSLE